MKINWQTKKISEVARICLGLTHTPKYVEEGVPFLSVKDISQGDINFNNTRLISQEEFNSMPEGAKPKKDDILFCRVGTIGYPQILNEEKEFGIFVSLGFFRVKKEILFNGYLAYWMESPSFDEQVKENVRGSTLKNLNTGWLKNFNILLPPLFEQKRIVKILDEVFEKIKEAKDNTEKNLQNSRELFESYLQSIFENPENDWEEKVLEEVCGISSKLIDPRKKDFLELLYIGAGNIETKTGQLINLKTSKEERLISGKFLFDSRMILYSKIRPYLMKVVRPEFNGLCSADIYPLLPKVKLLDRDFLFYLLLSPKFTDFAIKGSARAGMPKVNRERLFAYKFYLPTLSEQKEIVKKLNELAEQTKRLEEIYKQKLADLEELKKSILSKAFAGEL